jgi:hypothetical protein
MGVELRTTDAEVVKEIDLLIDTYTIRMEKSWMD